MSISLKNIFVTLKKIWYKTLNLSLNHDLSHQKISFFETFILIKIVFLEKKWTLFRLHHIPVKKHKIIWLLYFCLVLINFILESNLCECMNAPDNHTARVSDGYCNPTDNQTAPWCYIPLDSNCSDAFGPGDPYKKSHDACSDYIFSPNGHISGVISFSMIPRIQSVGNKPQFFWLRVIFEIFPKILEFKFSFERNHKFCATHHIFLREENLGFQFQLGQFLTKK